ncbi:MAG: prolipoprotein diacylglyceryl transferase [Cyclobacteriaceae bacterium]
MHPVLFEFDLFGLNIPLYSYGVMIMFGAIAAHLYIGTQAKKQLNIDAEKTQALTRIIIFTAFIGGKLLFYMEDPAYYFASVDRLLKNFRTGFVFYGSLLFAVPSVIWFFRKNQLPVLPMLDIVAVAGVILHAFGRMGCFLAGCCYGLPTDGPLYVEFTNELSKAPLNQHLHPTQLYSITLLLCILVVLLMFKRHQRFTGQLFLIYIALYAIGRGIIEVFRGDEERGYIIQDYLTHSQFISLMLVGVVIWYYIKLERNKAKSTSAS